MKHKNLMYDNIADYTSYDEIVDAWGYETVDSDVFGSYQGDLAYLLRDGDSYGWIIIGYGSCSGCDTLEALYGNRDGIIEFAESLRESIIWHDKQGMADYLDSDIISSNWSWFESGFKEFVTKVIEEHLS